MKKLAAAICLLLCFAFLTSCSFVEEVLIPFLLETDTEQTGNAADTAAEIQNTEPETEAEQTGIKTEKATESKHEPYVNDYTPSYGGKTVYINKKTDAAEEFWKKTLQTDRDIAAYESLVKMMKNGAKEAKPGVRIGYKEMGRIYALFRIDHPEAILYGDSYNASGYENAIDAFMPSLPFAGEESAAKARFDSAANSVLALIPDNATDIEAEKIIFDWLCDNVEYDLGAKHPRSAYGALVDKRCVCVGFADAFVYLCNKVGIRATGVNGIGRSGEKTENHRWCAVMIGGKWYLCDPTWGQGMDQQRYLYFNNSAYIKTNHTPDADKAPYLPDLSSVSAGYFEYYGLTFDDNTFDEAFLRALDQSKDMMKKTPAAYAMIKAEQSVSAEKYADMIENETAPIQKLMSRFNEGKDRTYILYGDVEIKNGNMIIFKICRI